LWRVFGRVEAVGSLDIVGLLVINGPLVGMEVDVVVDTTGSLIVGRLIVGSGVRMDVGKDVGSFVDGAIVAGLVVGVMVIGFDNVGVDEGFDDVGFGDVGCDVVGFDVVGFNVGVGCVVGG
jgi:hypothetical protein